MNVFDCFCGVGPWQTRDKLLPYRDEDILELMDHFGVGRALVHSNFSAARGEAVHGNRIVQSACGKQSRFVPAFALPPNPHRDAPGPADGIDAMRAADARAVWLCASSGMLHPWLYGEALSACEAMRIPVFLERDRGTPDDIYNLCAAFPELRLILVGVGYAEDNWLYPLLHRFENLHVSLGNFYVPPASPMRFLQHFPADRLLFGSGLPHFSPGGLIAHMMYADIPEDDRRKILAGNLTRLLAEAQL